MKLPQAKEIADSVVNMLSPYCERIMIAGSIRRNKPEVKDIEVVCIPKGVIAQFNTVNDLWGETKHIVTRTKPCKEYVDAVNMYTPIKGEADGKYTQRMLTQGIVLDLFTATYENWGYILAMRTGSAAFSKEVLATGWVKNGYNGHEGMLFRNGIPVPVREEIDLFNICNVKYLEPQWRSL